MGAMLRSDPMSYCDMFLQPEAAFEILSQLGEMGCVQFIDMTPEVQAFQRRYVSEVCRCAEMERRLRFMESEMVKDNIYMPKPIEKPKTMQPNEMLMYENMFEKWEDDISEMSENQSSLMKNYFEMIEMFYLLSHIGPILGNAEISRESIFNSKKGLGDIGTGGRLFVMTGVVRRSKSFPFEMMLWRISRGNIYYRQAAEDITVMDPHGGKEIRKVAFLAVCQGEQLSVRMEKVFSGFRVNSYPCPQTVKERNDMMSKIEDRINDLEQVLEKSTYHRCRTLRTVGRQWCSWMIQIRKAKAIYHNMNLFTLDITKNCLIGQCWVPDKDLKRVQDTLEFCSVSWLIQKFLVLIFVLETSVIGTNVPSFVSKTRTDAVPPTFHRTNKFTNGFQALINAYGDSKYGELNPGLYTLITFPFFFALMFGDVGHALILSLFALWMLINEKKFMAESSTNEIWNIFFGGRYVILLLGLFSVYTGLIYNDWFSRTLAVTNSYYMNAKTSGQLLEEEFVTLQPSGKYYKPYAFGVDPIWALSTNKIMIENMIKMKMSIIIGIIHMIFGIVLSFFNHVHFKNTYSIYLQFIPELMFLCCLFFWLVIMVFYKWFFFSARHPDPKLGAGCAPQILILFIDMFLMAKTKPVEEDCDAYMFPAQRTVQVVLVLVALACIPILLLGTPIYIHNYNKKKRDEAMKKISNFRSYQHRDSDKKMEELVMAEVAIYMSSFSELMIHQSVHTIEFVLSTISHTASYLRLWALSLAHAQLSEMLWSMILSRLALKDHSFVGVPKLFIVFTIWAAFTVSILVVMEGLSAFLHTLRLHWVEFMSKFYSGGGYPFRPFSFKVILSGEGDKPDAACKSKTKKKDVAQP